MEEDASSGPHNLKDVFNQGAYDELSQASMRMDRGDSAPETATVALTYQLGNTSYGKDDLISALTNAIDLRLDTRLVQFRNDLTDLKQEISDKDERMTELHDKKKTKKNWIKKMHINWSFCKEQLKLGKEILKKRKLFRINLRFHNLEMRKYRKS